MPETTTHAETAEAVRAVIATHAQLSDEGRGPDCAALYTEDAIFDVAGQELAGPAAIAELIGSGRPAQPQRHHLSNTVVTASGDGEAAAQTDLVFVQGSGGAWQIMAVGRYYDTLVRSGGRWLFSHRRFVLEDPS